MTFKNMIFETDDEGLENMIKFFADPQSRGTIDYTHPTLYHNITEGKSMPHNIKINAITTMDQPTYDGLILQLMFNKVKFHNIKFAVPEKETENIERFISENKDEEKKKNIYYLQHMRKIPGNGHEEKFTAKISTYKNATKTDIVNLMSFMRQYL